MSVHQVILVLKDISPIELVKVSVKAGMEIMNQFNPTSSSYTGSFEEKNFKKVMASWSDAGFEQKIFFVDKPEDFEEVEFHANMEGAPTNFIQEGQSSNILVIGPYDTPTLDFYTQNYKQS